MYQKPSGISYDFFLYSFELKNKNEKYVGYYLSNLLFQMSSKPSKDPTNMLH